MNALLTSLLFSGICMCMCLCPPRALGDSGNHTTAASLQSKKQLFLTYHMKVVTAVLASTRLEVPEEEGAWLLAMLTSALAAPETKHCV
jgi:hypothetical protein